MEKIEFFFRTKTKRDAVRQFYNSLGLKTSVKSKTLKIRGTPTTKILAITQNRIYLRTKAYSEIIAAHKDLNLKYDLEAGGLEKDFASAASHLPHHIPTRITITDPLSNTLCISPSLTPKRVAVLTSGGDAPGMNAAIWAISRTASKNGASVVGVRNGYTGLLLNEIEPLTEEVCFAHMHLGGTFLGSARAKEMRTPEGLAQAVSVLEQNEIDSLIVIGGDGSMRGALSISEKLPSISVVFIPASIDNDIPGTLSLGASTALHRITESIDCIESTMASHRRGFVLEVMGRACGWLGLASAFSSEAAYLLLPEYPPGANWREELRDRVRGRRCAYVILSEGARENGRKIGPEEVRQVMEAAGMETRAVVLGHTQRGGAPCATDRMVAPILGVAAAEVALSKTGGYAVTIKGFTGSVVSLGAAVRGLANKEKGEYFRQMYEEVIHPPLTSTVNNPLPTSTADNPLPTNTTDNPLPTNTAEKSIQLSNTAEKSIQLSNTAALTNTAEKQAEQPTEKQTEKQTERPSGICIGVVGAESPGADLLIANIRKAASKRGIESEVLKGCFAQPPQKRPPGEEERLKEALKGKALALIGGLDALAEAKRVRGLCRAVFILPCTVSNNVPGTDASIGADTALDTITALCDNLKVSGAQRVAYIVEVFGGACGYLSVAAALATGALDCYFPEELSAVKGLSRSVRALRKSFSRTPAPQLIIRGNGAVRGVCSETAARVLEADGRGAYSVRSCALGHIQKGNRPTAVDRYRAAQMALRLVQEAEKGFYSSGEWVIGVAGEETEICALPGIESKIVPGKRRVREPAWLEAARSYRALR